MKSNVLLIGILLVLTIFPFVLATDNLGTIKVNQPYIFCQVCSDGSYITLSSINTPNSTELINLNMTSTGSKQFCYNYTPTKVGRYDFRGISDGCDKTFATYVDVTSNGQERADGTVIIAFSMVFLIILFYSVFMMVNMLAHVFTLDYDAIDMALTLGGYVAMLGVNMLERIYLMNPNLENWLDLFIQVGLWTHVILPIMSFIFVLTVGQFIKTKLWTPRQ